MLNCSLLEEKLRHASSVSRGHTVQGARHGAKRGKLEDRLKRIENPGKKEESRGRGGRLSRANRYGVLR